MRWEGEVVLEGQGNKSSTHVHIEVVDDMLVQIRFDNSTPLT